MTLTCWSCKTALALRDKPGRGDVCPHCRNDLRVCKNCTFYDAKAYNECREPAADRVVDKERANFCDFFSPFGGQRDMDAKADDARAKLEALFKKG